MVNHSHKAPNGRNWTSAAALRLMEIAGQTQTVEHAVEIMAARLLKTTTCPPTDLHGLTDRLHVALGDLVRPTERLQVKHVKEDLPHAGELRQTSDGFEIVCSTRSSRLRGRFSTAHEIGHIIFEKSGPNPPRFGSELERICDMIAVELLMPTELFKKRFLADTSIGGIFNLSKTFGTSLSATAIRCHEVSNLPVFEVHSGRVSWARGLSKGERLCLDQALRNPACGNIELRNALHVTLGNRPVSEEVLLYGSHGKTKEVRLEGLPFASGTHALFIALPRR